MELLSILWPPFHTFSIMRLACCLVWTGLLVTLVNAERSYQALERKGYRGARSRRRDNRRKKRNKKSIRIIGGSPAVQGKHPYYTQGKGCGASLVSRRLLYSLCSGCDLHLHSFSIGLARYCLDGSSL